MFAAFIDFVRKNFSGLFPLLLGGIISIANILGLIEMSQDDLLNLIILFIALLAANLIQHHLLLGSIVSKLDKISNEKDKDGVIKLYQNMNSGIIIEMFEEAKREIVILQTWISQPEMLFPTSLVAAINKEVKTRILLLSPNSSLVQQRYKDTSRYELDSVIASERLKGLCRKIKEEKLDKKKNLGLRLYDALPPFTLYVIDDWMLIGFLWHGKINLEGTHIQVDKRGSRYAEDIMATFENLWGNIETVTANYDQIIKGS